MQDIYYIGTGYTLRYIQQFFAWGRILDNEYVGGGLHLTDVMEVDIIRQMDGSQPSLSLKVYINLCVRTKISTEKFISNFL